MAENGDCKFGEFCDNKKCERKHPDGRWPKCENFKDCKSKDCKDRHESNNPCHGLLYGEQCDKEECQFDHDAETITYWAKRNKSNVKRTCKYGTRCTNKSCKFIHPEKSSYQSIPKGVCRYFATGAECRFGEDCKYAHSASQKSGNVRAEESIPGHVPAKKLLTKVLAQKKQDPSKKEQIISSIFGLVAALAKGDEN